MGKIFFLLAVIAVVYLLLRNYRKSLSRQEPSATAEEMVRCAQCGVHLPKGEAILAGGSFYCCDDHRREHAGK